MNKLFGKSLFYALIPMAGFALFYVIPYLYVVYYSLNDRGSMGISHFWSVITNEFFILALKNTAVFVFLLIPVLLVLGYGFTEIAIRFRYGEIFNIVLFLPVLIPSVSSANMWSELFPGEALFSVIILFIWKNAGLITLIMTAGRRKVPREILDAAVIDGAGAGVLHRSIIFPLMIPVIFFSALIGLLQSFRIFREIYLMYHAYPPEDLYMMPHYIFNKFNKLDYGELSAGTILFTLLIAGMAVTACLCVKIYTKGRGNK